MARRRRAQWIDAIDTTFNNTVLAGAAAPGTIVNTTILSEAELENIGGGGTLIRTIGEIIVRRTAGAPVITCALFMAQNFTGAVAPTDWDADTFQREQQLGSWMVAADSTLSFVRLAIDLRSKRKLTQGMTMQLAAQNHAVAANDASLIYHLRCLVLLP